MGEISSNIACPPLCHPMDCSPPGSSVHGIFQARILEWVAISSSRGSSRPRDRNNISCVSCTGKQIFYHCTTWVEKVMAPHSSTLAWKIPWVEEPGRLQSMGLWRVGHNWATSLSLFTFMHWRRKWQPTPVFLPGEFQGRGSLVGCRSMGSHRVGYDWSDLAAAAPPGKPFLNISINDKLFAYMSYH